MCNSREYIYVYEMNYNSKYGSGTPYSKEIYIYNI